MENKNNNLQLMEPNEFKQFLREMIQEEFETINKEIQTVIGKDNLIGSRTSRLPRFWCLL